MELECKAWLPGSFSAADIDLVFSHLDADGSGEIDYVELNSKLRPKTCRTQVHKLRTSVSLRRGAGPCARSRTARARGTARA